MIFSTAMRIKRLGKLTVKCWYTDTPYKIHCLYYECKVRLMEQISEKRLGFIIIIFLLKDICHGHLNFYMFWGLSIGIYQLYISFNIIRLIK